MQASLLALVMVGAAVGCGQNQEPRAKLVGTFIEAGGPAPGSTFPIAGRVVAESQTGQVFTVTVGRSGHFQLLLPPGTYRLTGYSSGCIGRGGPITVRAARQAAHVEVVCPIP